jgi:hypothetical protein
MGHAAVAVAAEQRTRVTIDETHHCRCNKKRRAGADIVCVPK